MRTHLLLVATGTPIEGVRQSRGGYPQLFSEALRRGVPDAEVEVFDLFGWLPGAPLPELGAYDGVVFTGSASMVDEDTPWMRQGVRWIQQLVAEEIPYLGVCFGHQLLGVAMGADVGPNPRGFNCGTRAVHLALGAGTLPGGPPPSFLANVSHRDVIRDPGPRLRVIATAAHDPAHAVSAGPVAWGVQFHPEFDEEVVSRYLSHHAQRIVASQGEEALAQWKRQVQPTPHSAEVLSAFARLARDRRRGDNAGGLDVPG